MLCIIKVTYKGTAIVPDEYEDDLQEDYDSWLCN